MDKYAENDCLRKELAEARAEIERLRADLGLSILRSAKTRLVFLQVSHERRGDTALSQYFEGGWEMIVRFLLTENKND